MEGIVASERPIELATLENLKRYTAQIKAQAVLSKGMPLGNKTGMTLEGRAKLATWMSKQ